MELLIGYLFTSLVIIFIGNLFGEKGLFFAIIIIFISIGRQICNRMVKLFYFTETIVIIFIGLIWGGIVALLLKGLFLWTHPSIILVIIGYSAGFYASIINYDVFMRDPRLSRLCPGGRLEENQNIINFASIIGFVLVSIIIYFIV